MERKLAVLAVLLVGTRAVVQASVQRTAVVEEHRVDRTIVNNLIRMVKDNDAEGIAKIINYPLGRQYPLPPIEDEESFLESYGEIFDDNFREKIVNSDIHNDWHSVGWRGVMFAGGSIWLNYEGKIIAINYESKASGEHYRNMVDEEKKVLKTSLKNFKRPVAVFETEKFKIRIDIISEDSHGQGNDKYRYASWSRNRPMSTEPDIIINDCYRKSEGNMGGYSYLCRNGNYVYIVEVNELGPTDSSPMSIAVYRNNNIKNMENWKYYYYYYSPQGAKQILQQEGIIKKDFIAELH